MAGPDRPPHARRRMPAVGSPARQALPGPPRYANIQVADDHDATDPGHGRHGEQVMM